VYLFQTVSDGGHRAAFGEGNRYVHCRFHVRDSNCTNGWWLNIPRPMRASRVGTSAATALMYAWSVNAVAVDVSFLRSDDGSPRAKAGDILSPENCNPGSCMALPGRNGWLETLGRVTSVPTAKCILDNNLSYYIWLHSLLSYVFDECTVRNAAGRVLLSHRCLDGWVVCCAGRALLSRGFDEQPR